MDHKPSIEHTWSICCRNANCQTFRMMYLCIRISSAPSIDAREKTFIKKSPFQTSTFYLDPGHSEQRFTVPASHRIEMILTSQPKFQSVCLLLQRDADKYQFPRGIRFARRCQCSSRCFVECVHLRAWQLIANSSMHVWSPILHRAPRRRNRVTMLLLPCVLEGNSVNSP